MIITMCDKNNVYFQLTSKNHLDLDNSVYTELLTDSGL